MVYILDAASNVSIVPFGVKPVFSYCTDVCYRQYHTSVQYSSTVFKYEPLL